MAKAVLATSAQEASKAWAPGLVQYQSDVLRRGTGNLTQMKRSGTGYLLSTCSPTFAKDTGSVVPTDEIHAYITAFNNIFHWIFQ